MKQLDKEEQKAYREFLKSKQSKLGYINMTWYRTTDKEDFHHIFICDCVSEDHRFSIYGDQESGELSLTVHLSTYKGFFHRLWCGLKYIFGFQTSRYGDYDSVILNSNDIDKTIELLQDWKNKMENKK